MLESSDSSESMTQRVGVEEVSVRPRLKAVPPSSTLPPPPPPVQIPVQSKTDPAKLEMMLRTVIQVLSLRAILLLALIGAFVLSLRSMANGGYASLIVLAIYCLCAILPVAYLEIRRHQP